MNKKRSLLCFIFGERGERREKGNLEEEKKEKKKGGGRGGKKQTHIKQGYERNNGQREWFLEYIH